MSDNVHKLGVVKLEQTINEATVRILEDLLAEAKRGDVQEVFVITRNTDDTWSEHASPTQRFREWVGQIEIVKANWIRLFQGVEEEQG